MLININDKGAMRTPPPPPPRLEILYMWNVRRGLGLKGKKEKDGEGSVINVENRINNSTK